MSQEFKDCAEAMSYIALLNKPVPILPPLSLYKPKPKDQIAGGDPVRTPIDRVAARVVAPAPEWAKPPPPPATKAERFIMKSPHDKYDNMTTDAMSRSTDGGASKLAGLKKEEDLNIEIASGYEKHFGKRVQDTEDLVKRSEEAAAAIEYLVTHVKTAWVDYEEWLIKALKNTRATKVAIEIETKQTLATLGDIRKFFLDEKHEQEVEKLREFVDLCERLRDLQKSGFLDTISDTILRLSLGERS